jgi:hypothetical protein
MALTTNPQSHDLAGFKQQIFQRLAFLGMPQGDATKFVDLSMTLITSGIEGRVARAEAKRLVMALSRVLGKPRADLFVKWLVAKIPEACSSTAIVQPSDSKQTTVQTNQQHDSCSPGAAAVAAVAAWDETQAAERRLGAPTCSKTATVRPQSEQLPSPQVCAEALTKVNKQPPSAEQQVIDDESWVEVKSKEGKTYFWSRSSNSCSWALPAGVRAKWTSNKSAEGRTYYYDRTGTTVWVLPPLKIAPSDEGDVSVPILVPHTLADADPKAAACLPSAEPETPVSCRLVAKASEHATDPGGTIDKTVSAPDASVEPETPVTCSLHASHKAKLADISNLWLQCQHLDAAQCDAKSQAVHSSHRPSLAVTSFKIDDFLTDADGLDVAPRDRSRSPRRRGLSPDAKLKLANKIAALKQGPNPKIENKLEDRSVFEFQQSRRASTGGA